MCRCVDEVQAYVVEYNKYRMNTNTERCNMVVIYGTEICSHCLRAKRLAETYGLSFDWIDLDDPSNVADLKRKVPDYKTIPQIFWHGKHVGGFVEFARDVENTLGGYGDGKL